MSRVTDVINDVKILQQVVVALQDKQVKMHPDLYATIKEVSELRYRMVELETRLSNLSATVKAMHEKGG